MCSLFNEYPAMEEYKPLPVVIIGNGPSGICLSYLLSGYTPYILEGSVQLNPILQKKLEKASGHSVLDQDLEYFSEGLEGRSHSLISLLFDTLLRPDTDFGGNAESLLTWQYEPERAVPHLVLGKGLPGGAWHSIEGGMITLSRGEWMSLPDLPVKEWLRRKRRSLRNDRATAGDIAKYYQYYVKKKDLQDNFICGSVVTSVRKLNNLTYEKADSSRNNCFLLDLPEQMDSVQRDNRHLFQVDGFVNSENGSRQPFSIYAENVVLATGTSDSPSLLGVNGEDHPFISHSISALEDAVRERKVHQTSDPVLIVGAGLSAADAILFAHHCNIPVIHAFRRKVNDSGLIFNQLPQMMYPEYHKVYQMMREQSIFGSGPYEGYVSLPEHRILSFKEDKKCVFEDKNGHKKIYNISMAIILIGSNPNLSFLPNNGMHLAIENKHPVNAKRNPIDINPFTYECVQEKGIYAVGPLAGDYFVRFVQGGALAAAKSLLRKVSHKPP
uniref:Oxidative stress-induced growth inhibitor 1 n=1 Tax=Geotrypetes seraphini TaxID=260995 RepID=A0A6P8RES7_GEOSA|nr:oxidative stress-induced growth inhibitor 1 [Geotrypetes seraphini]